MAARRSLFVAMSVCAVSAAIVACSTFDESDATPAPVDGGNDGASASDGDRPGKEDGSASDGGVADGTTKDAGDPSVRLKDEFEVAVDVTCPKWTVNGATAFVVAGGRDGGNACRVCPMPEGYISRSIPTSEPGDWSATLYARRDLAATQDGGEASFRLAYDANNDAGEVISPSGLGGVTDSWVRLQTTLNNAKPLTEVVVRVFTMDNSTDCYLIDDVEVRKD